MTADKDKTPSIPSSSSGNEKKEEQTVALAGKAGQEKTKGAKPSDNNAGKASSDKVEPGKKQGSSSRETAGKATPSTVAGSASSAQADLAAVVARKQSRSGSGNGLFVWLSGLFAVLVVILVLAMWWQNQRFELVSREVADRLQHSDQQVMNLAGEVRKSLAQNHAQSEQISNLQKDLQRLRKDMMSADSAWQSFSQSLDDRLLVNYLRRLLNLGQQLVLTGQVSGAISVLEGALDMIQGHQGQEHFVALTNAINVDLERLRALPLVDVSTLSDQLGKVVALSEKAPLLVPDIVAPKPVAMQGTGSKSLQQADTVSASDGNAQESSSQPVAEELPWWKRILNEAGDIAASIGSVASKEFSDLMQIRRVDSPSVLLLSDEQAMLVRTNLRSVLLGAQLALLNRQNPIWEAELDAAISMLHTYYDGESVDVRAALKLLQELRSVPVSIDAKPLTESLSALAVAAQAVTVPAASGDSH